MDDLRAELGNYAWTVFMCRQEIKRLRARIKEIEPAAEAVEATPVTPEPPVARNGKAAGVTA